MEKRSPWAWIPSLYFAEGLPYVVVMTLSVIMYKRLGVSNTDIALFTSWLYFPWVIKPIWSPFVDLIKTKRWWIYGMQLLIGGGMAGVAFVLPGDFFLRFTLAFFWLMAFSSATHDIAADGFYMLGLTEEQQAFFIGIRNTFYRVAMLTGQGLLRDFWRRVPGGFPLLGAWCFSYWPVPLSPWPCGISISYPVRRVTRNVRISPLIPSWWSLAILS